MALNWSAEVHIGAYKGHRVKDEVKEAKSLSVYQFVGGLSSTQRQSCLLLSSC